jgi:hypothetical protein
MNVRFRPGLVLVPLVLWLVDARPSQAAPPRLLAPKAGAELIAGSLASVEWEGAPARAEEWEAFLSLDGGRTYPLRITPHLDLSLRRFTFRVPQVLTREARVMLRFGDERRETEYETPQRFAIVPGRGTWSPPAALALARGERPRPRDAGVVVWVEGSRDGGGLREVAATAAPLSLRSVEPSRLPWMPLLGPVRSRTAPGAPTVPSEDLEISAGRAAASPCGTTPGRATVRLLIHRFNE